MLLGENSLHGDPNLEPGFIAFYSISGKISRREKTDENFLIACSMNGEQAYFVCGEERKKNIDYADL